MKFARLICLLASVLLPLSASAQKYTPTEPWPYLYEEFTPGNVFTSLEGTIGYDQLNVNIIDGKLHYIKEGTIMEAAMGGIHVVGIDKDVYLNVGGKLMLLLKEADHCAVVKGTEIDYDEMAKVNIGYGKSATASTQNISLMSLSGSDNLNKSLSVVEQTKYNGKVLPLKEHIYLVVDGILVRATKSDVISTGWADKKEVSSFVKTNKIKWNDPEGLSLLGEYLYEAKK